MQQILLKEGYSGDSNPIIITAFHSSFHGPMYEKTAVFDYLKDCGLLFYLRYW